MQDRSDHGKDLRELARDDGTRLHTALDAMDLIDSGLSEAAWEKKVRERLGDSIVDEWSVLTGQEYDFTYDSFEAARHFSVSWRSRPLAAECEWMMPRLRDAIARCGHDEPFLLEIGAGPGAAAAILSAALDVRVVTVDSHPKSLGLPEQFAELTDGRVESRIGDLADLAAVLDGAKPAAVFGLGIYRHIQAHVHSAKSFSDWWPMQKILDQYTVGPDVKAFIDALGGADLIVSEIMCADYLAEMCAGLSQSGYRIPRGGIRRIEGATPSGPTVAFGVHFSTADLPERDPNLLIEMCSPLPRPHLDFSTPEDDPYGAEALRLSLEPTEFIDAAEVDYTDGSARLRHEVFGLGKHLVGQYVSSTGGFRNLKVFARNDLEAVLGGLRDDEEELERVGAAMLYRCKIPAPQWDGPLDTAENLVRFEEGCGAD